MPRCYWAVDICLEIAIPLLLICLTSIKKDTFVHSFYAPVVVTINTLNTLNTFGTR